MWVSGQLPGMGDPLLWLGLTSASVKESVRKYSLGTLQPLVANHSPVISNKHFCLGYLMLVEFPLHSTKWVRFHRDAGDCCLLLTRFTTSLDTHSGSRRERVEGTAFTNSFKSTFPYYWHKHCCSLPFHLLAYLKSCFGFLLGCFSLTKIHVGVPEWLSQLSAWLDFGSGHDHLACEFEPCLGLCPDSMEPAWDSLSLSLSLSLFVSLSLSKIK